PDTEEPSDSVSIEEEILQGFRIQIFASASIDEANLARQLAAQAIVDDSLYIVYDPPVYKVRVGDYLTRLAANRALTSVLQHGYPDAWVVTDRIIQRKTVRIPREEY
ncbi:MAG: SPOR domain-containing protein, partial [Bacteroidota bacterium]